MQDTLSKAKVGRVYNFEYKQPHSGDAKRHLARVVNVNKFSEGDIVRLAAKSRYRYGDPQFVRTETVVTCQMPDGNYRNFYGERTEKCRHSLFATLLFWTGLGRLFAR